MCQSLSIDRDPVGAYLKMFHSFDIFLRGLGGLRVWVVELEASSKVSNHVSVLNHGNVKGNPLGSLISVIPATTALNLPNKPCLESSVTNTLHHGKMFEVVMSLK